MKTVKIFAIAILALVASTSVKAQFSVGTDIVSNYVWRGVEQDLTNTKGTPNIQPSISFTAGKFTIGAWGSAGILGTVKEVDVYATFAISSLFSITVTDYNWNFSQSYFAYADGTDHVFEGSLNYAGVESFPLSVSLNTMFYGADKIATSETTSKQAYSTYLELAYPISANAKIFLGGSLNESANYGTSGFGITNAALKVSKSIEITDKFSLPVYGVVGVNPTAKDAFLVLGVTL
jgi:hypothetical protein